MSSHLRVHTHQMPVGQGGMLICTIETGGEALPFSFMFDCGSLDRKLIGKVLTRESKRLPHLIAVLFISHLDIDHVQGIDLLFTNTTTKVHTVVLPHIDTFALLSAAATTKGDVTSDYLAFLSDPVGWLRKRDVRVVIQLARDNGDNGTLASDFDADPVSWGPREDRDGPRLEVTGRQAPGEKRNLSLVSRDANGQSKATQKLSMSSVQFRIGRRGAAPLWIVAPYCHMFDTQKMTAFHAKVAEFIKTNLAKSPSAWGAKRGDLLQRVIGDPALRAKLKKCYKALHDDDNVPSLSLYSGEPPNSAGNGYLVGTALKPYWWREGERWNQLLGWLTTGDAILTTNYLFDAWRAFFSPILDKVGIFVLPHHGSKLAFTAERLQSVTELQYAQLLVCAKSSAKKHPHPDLVADLAAIGKELIRVNERPESRYFEIARV